MTPRARIAIIVVALVALAAAFVAASGTNEDTKRTSGSSTTSPAPATGTPAASASTPAPAPAAPVTPVISVVGAKPRGGVERLTYNKGDVMRFRVASDTADEIHVHGYDVHKDVAAGGSVRFSIPATIEGRFVVELEGHATQIAELEVAP